MYVLYGIFLFKIANINTWYRFLYQACAECDLFRTSFQQKAFGLSMSVLLMFLQYKLDLLQALALVVMA